MVIQQVIIHRFGKHAEQSWTFGEGVNLLTGPNEWGKSTFFSFLRAVLYGLNGRGNENERKRYAPWGGGDMSGELVFTHQHLTYRAICTYGLSRRSDKVHLYNEVSGEEVLLPPGQTIGEAILGLSAGAFDSSLYIGQLSSKIQAGQDKEGLLLQKLSALTGQGENDTSVKEVEKRLKQAMDSLRAPRSGNGILDRLQNRENACEQTLAELEQREEKASRLREERDGFQRALQETDSVLAEQKQRQKQAQAALLLQKKQEIEKKRHLCQQLEQAVPQPTSEQWQEEITRLEQEANKLQTDLANQYAQEAALGKSLTNLRTEQQATRSSISALSDSLSRRTAAPEEEDTLEAIVVKKKWFYLTCLLFSLAVVSSVVSLAAFFALSFPLLTIFSGMAAAGSIIGGLLANLRRIHEAAEAAEQRVQQQWNWKRQKDQLKTMQIRAAELVREIASQETERQTLLQSLSRCQEAKDQNQAALQQARQAWQASNKQQGLHEKEAALLKQLLEGRTLAEWDTLSRAAEESLTGCPSSFRQKSKDALEAILHEAAQQEQLLLEKRSRLAEQYHYRQASLDALYPEDASDCYSEVYQERLYLKEQIQSYQRKYQALELVRQMISHSFEELQTRFGPALSRQTGAILSQITGGQHEQVKISKDFSVTVWDEASDPHDSACFSGATVDQIYFALRVALSQLIRPSPEEPYPLLLDDPFVQYDPRRWQLAMAFLQEYSKEHHVQVLLATCRLDGKEDSI